MNDFSTSPVGEPSPLSRASMDFLAALGDRLQGLRMRRGMTRRDVCKAAGISERHLANLERGIGNGSILVLQQIAGALDCSLSEVVGEAAASSPEWLMIRALLSDRNEAEMRRALSSLQELFGAKYRDAGRNTRISLIGLRGAGKSTLGAMLAESLDFPFVELSREVERHAGCSVREIHDLYGVAAYRRYERRAIEEIVQLFSEVVIATPGGLVAEPATLNELLHFCTTIWIKASPEEHMSRVLAQGDTRPMAQNPEAMDDLKKILSSRSAFYARADLSLDTSGKALSDSFEELLRLVDLARAG